MDLCKLLDGEYLHETIKMQVSRCVVQLLHLQQALRCRKPRCREIARFGRDSIAPVHMAHTTAGQTAELGCPEQTGETAHPSIDGTHGVTINLEILSAIFLDKIGHFCQICHVLPRIWHLDITEAFDRNLGQLGLASIGQLASPG